MTTPFIGEIQIFGFNFVANGWAACDGTTMSVSQNTTLFSLIGTAYGGNGSSTFQLPNLVDRAACSQGQGPGLTPRTIGEPFGEISHTLVTGEMPTHTHAMTVYGQSNTAYRTASPQPGNWLGGPVAAQSFVPGGTPNTTLSPNEVAQTGGNQPHENRHPYLVLNYCIALSGDYPQFS
jgi:microcystin-dependent protein